MTATQRDRLLLIDGHALIYRAFHGMNSALTVSKTGETVSAVFGFTNTLLKSIADLEPSHIAVAFDLPGPTIRSELYPDYKAHRPPMPDELRQQISRIRQVVENFGISIYESAGYEADDV
ncbi:DNA polymerase I, partial [Dehalococcoidia bacterium]|nr:DNA polymerase I [Dehalococcoidia bacterium]